MNRTIQLNLNPPSAHPMLYSRGVPTLKRLFRKGFVKNNKRQVFENEHFMCGDGTFIFCRKITIITPSFQIELPVLFFRLLHALQIFPGTFLRSFIIIKHRYLHLLKLACHLLLIACFKFYP